MRIFVDANVLVSVLNKEYPLFSYSSRILSLADHKKFKLYTSPVCLAIAFYFAEKKHKTLMAKEKMAVLCEHISIAEIKANAVYKTLQNKLIEDFEDGLEYYAASDSKCECIITEDLNDYYFSEILVLNCEDFLQKYLCN